MGYRGGGVYFNDGAPASLILNLPRFFVLHSVPQSALRLAFIIIIMTDKSNVVDIVVNKVNLIRRISSIEQLPG